jgi:hypothetical protein
VLPVFNPSTDGTHIVCVRRKRHRAAAERTSAAPQVEDPFQVRNGKIGGQLALTIDNAKRDGVRVSERADGSQRAGSIQWAAAGQLQEFTIAKKPLPKSARVPLRFELLLNSVLSAEARYGTLVHELAHLYCGHLGTPNGRWWPDRQNLSHVVREFEAESVSYLVCTRLGIDTASDEYLAAYVRRCPATPSISLDRVMKSVWLLASLLRSSPPLSGASVLSALRLEPLVPFPLASPARFSRSLQEPG